MPLLNRHPRVIPARYVGWLVVPAIESDNAEQQDEEFAATMGHQCFQSIFSRTIRAGSPARVHRVVLNLLVTKAR